MVGFTAVVPNMLSWSQTGEASWLHRARDVFKNVAVYPVIVAMFVVLRVQYCVKPQDSFSTFTHAGRWLFMTWLSCYFCSRASAYACFRRFHVTSTARTPCVIALLAASQMFRTCPRSVLIFSFRQSSAFLAQRLIVPDPVLLTDSDRDLVPHTGLIHSVLVDIGQAHMRRGVQ